MKRMKKQIRRPTRRARVTRRRAAAKTTLNKLAERASFALNRLLKAL